MRIAQIGRFLYRRAENLLALMLAVMFIAFLLQIAFRYLLNLPTGWTSELTVVMWLWLVLWGVRPSSCARMRRSASTSCIPASDRGRGGS